MIFPTIKRFITINFTVIKGFLKFYLKYLDSDFKNPKELSKIEINVIIADTIISVIEELGAAFIKFGQILSSRPDMIPSPFIDKLKKLQDDVNPLKLDTIEQIFIEEFGKKGDEIFKNFSKKPIASASVAQVHIAELGDRKVAIKIQRPKIGEILRFDLDILKKIFIFFETVLPFIKRVNPVAIISEIEKPLFEQLDFIKEASYLKKFKENFKNSDFVVVPDVFDNFSTSKIITMEFLDGVKPTEYQKINANPLKIARYGIEMSLKMIYRDRFFHADPHPGNILLLDNGEKIGILDCGMVGFVSQQEMSITLNFILGIVQEDTKKIADTMLEACGGYSIISKNSYKSYLDDIDSIFHKFAGKKLSEIEFGVVISGIYKVLTKYKIRIAPNYTMIFVAMITIEGVAKTLAPDIDLISEARVYAFDMMSYLN
ncbi:AarF/ABC1/UbiB kinase family protein [bacterium]|nr:AarF/ABC1/UbiB kinase family protein [bacterium]